MDDFRASAENRLREHGYRLTRPRRQVLAVLAESDRALSPYAILEHLAQEGEAPDVVTVYRILELLESLQLVYRGHTLNGDAAYHHAPC
jgi:Fe2+ or Zn2+ uptake regulation protein